MDGKSFFLAFDRAKYYSMHKPCQVIVHTFHSAGISYCMEVSRGPGKVYMPVPKKAVKAAMEAGIYAWVADLKPRYVATASGNHLVIAMAAEGSSFAPLIRTVEDLERAYASTGLIMKRYGAKVYRYDEDARSGNNIPKPGKGELQW